MFAARAFWMTRRRAGFDSGLGPPFRTAMVISLPMRENSFDMRSQRANIVALRVSKMRPMGFRRQGWWWAGETQREGIGSGGVAAVRASRGGGGGGQPARA